ncbi:MAG: ABC transporter ATP-binding protein [Pseudomonadota bacterium]
MSAEQNPGTPVLELRDVCGRYGPLQVLTDVNLTLEQGQIGALFGPNGHGKSTLLKAISGIHPASSGRILYQGRDIAREACEKIVEMGVAYIPEARNLFKEMTVEENLTLGAFNRRARGDLKKNLARVYELFPRLAERREQVVSTLSGGESRMAAVGRGLMSGASLLLIDEPSIGLSPLMKKIVFEAVGLLHRETGLSILIVEQEVDYPLRLADRVFLLKKGRVVLEKPVGEIGKAEIEKAYF